MTGEAFGEVGSGYENGGYILCGGGAIGDSVWILDMGNDPMAGESPRGFPPPGSTADGRHGIKTSMGWGMCVPTHWSGNGNGGYG